MSDLANTVCSSIFRVSPVRIAWHDPEACGSPHRCTGEEEEHIHPQDRTKCLKGPAGAFAQEYTVMCNTLSDNKLYGHEKASQYGISDLTVL